MKVQGSEDTCHHQSKASTFGARRRRSDHSSHCGSHHHSCKHVHRTSPHFHALCSHPSLCKKAVRWMVQLCGYHSSDKCHRLDMHYNRLTVLGLLDRSYPQSEHGIAGTRLQLVVHSTNLHNPHPSCIPFPHIYSCYHKRCRACEAKISFIE